MPSKLPIKESIPAASLPTSRGPDVKFQKFTERLPFRLREIDITPEVKVFREAVDSAGPHRNLIEIYNHWVLNFLEKQITTKTLIHEDKEINFENVRVYKPDVFPYQARDANSSYMARVYVDLVDNYDNKTENVHLGNFPCMVGSVLCNLHGMSDSQLIEIFEDPNDPMGYFIIKGTERLIVTVERLRYSCFLTYAPSDKETLPETRMTCTEGFNTYIIIMKYDESYKYHGVVLQNQAAQERPINVLALFKLFGWDVKTAISEILKYVDRDFRERIRAELTSTITQFNFSVGSRTNAEIIDTINMKKNIEDKHPTNELRKQKILHDLFPNTEILEEKLELLAMMTSRQALYKCGFSNGEDRDSWSNKQLHTAGTSLEVDMNSTLTEMISTYANEKKKKQQVKMTLQKKINPEAFTKKFLDTFNNNLGPQGKIGNRTTNIATSEALQRETPLKIYSLATRINTPTDRQVKKASTRNVNGTQVGTVCLVQTPESIHCGLVKQATVVEHTSLSHPDGDAVKLIENSRWHSRGFKEGLYPILVNGRPKGWAPFELVEEINLAKRSGKLPFDCTCLLNGCWKTIEYFSNGGRVMYPVFVVKDNVLLYEQQNLQGASFQEMLKAGVIMYVDAREQEQEYNQLAESVEVVRLARQDPNNREKYTLAFIDGLSQYGINASLIPFANMTQGPRAVYQTSMFNQALGIYHYNHPYRFDTSFKKLIGPSRSLSESILAETIGMNTLPSSQTAIMAIYADPYNYEDAVTLGKQYIERGNMHHVIYSTHKITLKNSREMKDKVVFPKQTNSGNSHRYRNLDPQGYPIIGSKMVKDDFLIGLIRVEGNGNPVIRPDGTYEIPEGLKVSTRSVIVNANEEGYVDSYRITKNQDNETVIRIKLAQYKIVNIGDKFSAAQTAQKGTCGIVLDNERMIKIATGPNAGISPEIEFNTHGLPSRMTINMLFTMLLLRWAVYTGRRIDTTTHHQDTDAMVKRAVDDMYKYAKSRGMSDSDALDWAYGEEECVGPSGKPLGTKVFICPVTEQLLRHLVDTKIQCRGTGPIKKTNHQPTQGRSNNGGQKTGEMERDAMASHGASATLQERMRDVADLYETAMCANCGKFAVVNPHENTVTCRMCDDKAVPVRVKIPFSLKQTIQTVGGLQIDTTFELKPKR